MIRWMRVYLRQCEIMCFVQILIHVTALAKDSLPQLDAYDAEDEKYEKAQEEDVTQHG